jgi:hypothetical protein
MPYRFFIHIFMAQENEEFASQRSDAIQEAGKGELKKFGGSKQITDSRYCAAVLR